MAQGGMAKPLDRFAIVVMILLCVAWGGNQVAAKFALADFGPMTQCALRNGIGAVVVMVYALALRPGALRRDGTGWLGLFVGVLFTLEFVLLFFAVERTTAASSVVFLFTAPFFVAIGAMAVLPDERLAPRQWLGVVVAFLGVALGFFRPAEGSTALGDLLALGAGAGWGGTTLLIKGTRLRAIDPTRTLLYQVVTATVLSAPLALWLHEPFPLRPSAAALAGLLYQGVFVTGITYLIWFWILKRYRAPELSALTFISPVVGVLAGWVLLGETPNPSFLVALAGVAAGLALLSWPARTPLRDPQPAE
jgi:drug/metabolite transporter (DMT)-like permease